MINEPKIVVVVLKRIVVLQIGVTEGHHLEVMLHLNLMHSWYFASDVKDFFLVLVSDLV